ncbi:MAG TPA: 50S ribosomal protein L4 [Gaiellales bacterium]|nr:50S ribosomal protein L4 [Gaiellales bacterium]
MAAPTAPVLTGGAKAKLDESVFGLDRNDALVHEVVKSELAARRQGTSSAKTRGLVSGGRSKPWRQKGTGRARAGTTRASQWTGGGVVFGPSPRNHTGKVNRKAHRKALAIALSVHASAGTLAAVDAAGFEQPRTRQAAELVSGWREHGPLVVVAVRGEDALIKSFRNLDRTHVVELHDLEVADVVWARSLLVSTAALRRLAGEVSEGER